VLVVMRQKGPNLVHPGRPRKVTVQHRASHFQAKWSQHVYSRTGHNAIPFLHKSARSNVFP